MHHLWDPLELYPLDGLIVTVGDVGGILAELPSGGVRDGVVVALCHNVHVCIPAEIFHQARRGDAGNNITSQILTQPQQISIVDPKKY